ncbi:MAG: hypothetical protein ACXVNM_12550 [Bacteroidia bacterium]
MDYYKSYILNDKFKVNINELPNLKCYYEVFSEPQINVRVAKRHLGSIVDWVFYYTTGFSKELWDYHSSKFQHAKLAIIENVSINSFFVKEYDGEKLSRIWLYNTDEELKIINETMFSSDFKLSEYRENFYNEIGDLVKEKIFMPTVWRIHEEKPE